MADIFTSVTTATETQAGIAPIATQAQVDAGTNDAAFVTSLKLAVKLAAFVDAAPGTLDTLNELAAALGDDPNFATTVTNSLANKQPLHAILTDLAAQALAADTLPYGDGSNSFGLTALTAFARTLLDDADASTALTTLGVSAFIKTLLDDADAATARTTLGAQPLHDTLTAIAGGTIGHIERAVDNTQTITSGAAAATVLWNTSAVAGRGGVSYSAGVFTLATAGTYTISVYLAFGINATGRRQVTLRRNGAAKPIINQPASPAGVWSTVFSATFDCAAGDTIDVLAFQDSGSNLTLPLGEISIHRVA